MASEQKHSETSQANNNETVLTVLSMLGGLGIVMMVVAAAVGVVLPDIDSGLIGVLVMLGAGLLVAAIAGWVLVVRPYENFDDINEPLYHGHHHEDDHADEAHTTDAH